MTATVSEISAAIRSVLSDTPNLRVHDYLPDQINPPVAYVGIDTINYHGAFAGGNAEHEYMITVVVGRTSDRASQRALDDFLSYDGARSVRATLERDRTLGGVVQTSIVTRGGNLQTITIAEVTYVAVDFTMTVHP